jgi:hypothetical protein
VPSVAPVPSRMAVPMRVLAVPGGTTLAAAEPKPVGLSAVWKAPPPAVGVCATQSDPIRVHVLLQELDMHKLLGKSTHPCWAAVVVATVQVLILRAVLPVSVLPTAYGGLAGTAHRLTSVGMLTCDFF